MCGAGALMVLTMALVLLSARIANLETVLNRAQQGASRVLGADVAFDQVALSVFPIPRIVLNQSRLHLSEQVRVHIASLSVFPKIFPLLLGKFQVSKIVVKRPEITIKNAGSSPDAGGGGDLSLVSAQAKIVTAIVALWTASPGLIVQISGGSLAIPQADPSFSGFRDMAARIEMLPDTVDIDFQCRSELWDRMSVRGEIEPATFRARGSMALNGFRPQPIADRLPADFPVQVGLAPLDMTVRFEAERQRMFKAFVEGTFPELTVQRTDKTLVIRGNRLGGIVYMDKARTSVSLHPVALGQPAMVIAGKLDTGPFHLWRSSPVRLRVTIANTDVPAARQAVLAVAGDLPSIRMAVDIVRGGHIPRMVLTASGMSPEALFTQPSVSLEGSLAGGQVHIPWADLDLDAVYGDVSIVDGLLKGTNLQAELGSTVGKGGTLTLVDEKDDTLFELDIGVDADLSQLPPLLDRWIADGPFIDEVHRLDRVAGRAVGRLVLNGSHGALQTKVAVSRFDLSAEYQRLPQPITLSGGRFTYDATGVSVADVNGRLGQSTVSGFTARVDRQAVPVLAVSSGDCEIDAAAIHSWLMSFEKVRDRSRALKAADGMFTLSGIHLNGPFFEPGKWRFESRGRTGGLRLTADRHPAPLEIESAGFQVVADDTESLLWFEDAVVKWLGASLRLSGVLDYGPGGLDSVQMRFKGRMDTAFIQWFYDTLQLPSHLMVQGPLIFSQSRLNWHRDRRFSLAGNFSVEDGPYVLLDMVGSPNTLRINDLHVQDGESQASLSITVQPDRFQTAFFRIPDRPDRQHPDCRISVYRGVGSGRYPGNGIHGGPSIRFRRGQHPRQTHAFSPRPVMAL